MFVDREERSSSTIVAMASGDASTKGKAPIRVDDDDVVQEWLERKIRVLPQLVDCDCDPRFASTSGRGGLAALTGQESGVKNKKDN